MRIILALGVTLNIFSWSACAQETRNHKADYFNLQASYTGDYLNIIKGGIKKGSCYLGIANLMGSFHTEHAGLWRGGELFINGANTHGATPSVEYIGDYLVVSNIEAGEHTFFQELWYTQTIGPVALTIGLQDLSKEFAGSENGALYLNSAFGTPPTLTGNIPVSVFPLTAPGISVTWSINSHITWKNAMYDGSPTDFENNHYNLKWKLSKDDGLFAITELDFSYSVDQKPGTLKTGIYNHAHFCNAADDPAGHDTTYTHKIGLYVLADQVMWQQNANNRYLAAFCQFGLSPDDYHHNHYYLGLGFNLYGLFKRQGSDALGLALARAGMYGNKRHESSIELSYQFPVFHQFFLQPDIQYVVNPSGSEEILDNCVIASIRFGLQF